MICINELTDQKCNSREIISDFTILLSSYAPHIAEEIWSRLGNKKSVTKVSFPQWNQDYLIEEEINYPVSFNGKTRFTIALASDMKKEDVELEIMQHNKTIKYLGGKKPKKVIVVQNRIVNIVI